MAQTRTIYFDDDQLAEVAALAASERRSVSNMVAVLIDAGLSLRRADDELARRAAQSPVVLGQH